MHLFYLSTLTDSFSLNEIQFNKLFLTWSLILLSIVFVTFVVSELTRNYSQVDKLWSLVPIAYSWITAASAPCLRIYLMACLVTAWGFRLSYNFGRKGGYSLIPWKGHEDYRWSVMKENPLLRGRIKFGLFNLLFISLYQNILIFLFSSPLLIASVHSSEPVNLIDIFAALFMITFIIIESVADNQLFRFHQIKKLGMTPGNLYSRSLEKGFMTEGLWAYSRHPNFAAEQAIWFSFYFFGVAASGNWINVTLSGTVLLILLFIGSTKLTESISSRKYPDYGEYRKRVPKFIPDIFRKN